MNQIIKKRGGTRSGAGRKSKFKGPTTPIRVPVSKLSDIEKLINNESIESVQNQKWLSPSDGMPAPGEEVYIIFKGENNLLNGPLLTTPVREDGYKNMVYQNIVYWIPRQIFPPLPFNDSNIDCDERVYWNVSPQIQGFYTNEKTTLEKMKKIKEFEYKNIKFKVLSVHRGIGNNITVDAWKK